MYFIKKTCASAELLDYNPPTAARHVCPSSADNVSLCLLMSSKFVFPLHITFLFYFKS